MKYLIRIVYFETKIKNTFSADHFKSYAREISIKQDGEWFRVSLGSCDYVFVMNSTDGKTIDSWQAPVDPDEPKEEDTVLPEYDPELRPV